nr:MAG TPA: hypothetical protein [Caudoviricetes sp.]
MWSLGTVNQSRSHQRFSFKPINNATVKRPKIHVWITGILFISFPLCY